MIKPDVHWYEGLFLQPHHLQHSQASAESRLRELRNRAIPFPYGVVRLEVSIDELETGMVRFSKLHAVLPSGIEVSIPHNAQPPALDVRPILTRQAKATISLGVPLYDGQRANAFELGREYDSRVKLLYRPHEVEEADENSGQNSKPLYVRWLNARYLTDDDDASDMEVIPLLRVRAGVGEQEGRVRVDPEFVPPCLALGGSSFLRQLVEELGSQAITTRESTKIQLTRGGFNAEALGSLKLRQLMRLQVLARYAGELQHLLQWDGVTPFEYYRVLRNFQAELAGLSPDRDLFNVPDYDHNNLGDCFADLRNMLRSLLSEDVGESFIKVDFVESHDGLLQADLEEEHFGAPNAYYLGIKTKDDPTEVAKYIVNAREFKLVPGSKRNVYILGVPLEEDRHPPLELPAQSDLHYFRILRGESDQNWQSIEQERQAVLVWNRSIMTFADSQFSLYMTVPKS